VLRADARRAFTVSAGTHRRLIRALSVATSQMSTPCWAAGSHSASPSRVPHSRTRRIPNPLGRTNGHTASRQPSPVRFRYWTLSFGTRAHLPATNIRPDPVPATKTSAKRSGRLLPFAWTLKLLPGFGQQRGPKLALAVRRIGAETRRAWSDRHECILRSVPATKPDRDAVGSRNT
jgi:hypothetical protein